MLTHYHCTKDALFVLLQDQTKPGSDVNFKIRSGLEGQVGSLLAWAIYRCCKPLNTELSTSFRTVDGILSPLVQTIFLPRARIINMH
jgi:hypothetical protein